MSDCPNIKWALTRTRIRVCRENDIDPSDCDNRVAFFMPAPEVLQAIVDYYKPCEDSQSPPPIITDKGNEIFQKSVNEHLSVFDSEQKARDRLTNALQNHAIDTKTGLSIPRTKVPD